MSEMSLHPVGKGILGIKFSVIRGFNVTSCTSNVRNYLKWVCCIAMRYYEAYEVGIILCSLCNFTVPLVFGGFG